MSTEGWEGPASWVAADRAAEVLPVNPKLREADGSSSPTSMLCQGQQRVGRPSGSWPLPARDSLSLLGLELRWAFGDPPTNRTHKGDIPDSQSQITTGKFSSQITCPRPWPPGCEEAKPCGRSREGVRLRAPATSQTWKGPSFKGVQSPRHVTQQAPTHRGAEAGLPTALPKLLTRRSPFSSVFF